MDGGIRERVEALRREIAEIQELNLAYLQTPRRDSLLYGAAYARKRRVCVGANQPDRTDG